jgi:hypothetical protein
LIVPKQPTEDKYFLFIFLRLQTEWIGEKATVTFKVTVTCIIRNKKGRGVQGLLLYHPALFYTKLIALANDAGYYYSAAFLKARKKAWK